MYIYYIMCNLCYTIDYTYHIKCIPKIRIRFFNVLCLYEYEDCSIIYKCHNNYYGRINNNIYLQIVYVLYVFVGIYI